MQWGKAIDRVQLLIDDVVESIWTRAELRTLLEHAQLFVGLFGVTVEETDSLSLVAGEATYRVRDVFPRYVAPLRVVLGDLPLRWVHAATHGRLDRAWGQRVGTPSSYYVVGSELLGFFPTPSAPMSVQVTYLAVPPGGRPDSEEIDMAMAWQEVLPYYAAALCYAAEGSLARAEEAIWLFVSQLGEGMDRRFLPGSAQKLSAKEPAQFGAREPVRRQLAPE